VKAAPKLRQHFCLFLQVDRNRAGGEITGDRPEWHLLKPQLTDVIDKAGRIDA
jgi:hypothetical protein